MAAKKRLKKTKLASRSKRKKEVKKKKKSVTKKVKKQTKLTVKRKRPSGPAKKGAKTKSVEKARVKVKAPEETREVLPVSGDQRAEKLRKFLLDLRTKILSEAKVEIAKYIKGETKQIVETALDDGDWSVVDLTEDISLKQLSTHRENLMKIDEALRKLEQGTYGICEECGEEITEERLRILPFAIYCRECQERKEIREKIEKEYE